ncbi:MAG TPA: type I DNA topoisomerase, partial [Patescibacteria group bacterium]|nr:type I DNA topoisomerase [Patescibacteria group bacterium]
MNLVIVESPTKARTLKKFLGADYEIEASMGHVRDLPKSTLGIDVEHDFAPEYVKSEGKSAVISTLKKLSKTAKTIYLATDPDREGEAISWHIQELLKSSTKSPFVRSTFHEITKTAIQHAIDNPGTLNMDLVDAQQARRVLDRLVGYTLSPVLWKKVRRGLSAGRVQSVALRLIVEREKERLAFVPEEYWEISVDVVDEKSKLQNPNIKVMLWKKDDKEILPHTKEEADPIIADLQKAKYTVANVEEVERKRKAYPPFTTSTLQQAAANRLGFTSKRTMKLAQDLYERGLITYHRTDSFNLAESAIDSARQYISATFGPQYIPEKPQIYTTKSKNAQEAHEAIRPTDVEKKAEGPEFAEGLDDSHVKLYDLIWRRFIATQMKEARFNQTTIVVETTKNPNSKIQVSSYLLKTTGSVLLFDGWMKVFPGSDDVILPKLTVGQSLSYQDLEALQKFTQPPARYNDASLVKALEKLGIGRPSTYASIISVLEIRSYVEREAKAFVPTAIGTTVVDFLAKNFPKEMDYGFTAGMEDDLDAIARGEKKWVATIKAFFTPFKKDVEKVTETAERAQVPVEKMGDEICPLCKQGHLVIRSGRFGKFVSCDRFPDCKFTGKLIYRVEGMKCPECGEGEIREKSSKRGKFYGCSRYPNC